MRIAVIHGNDGSDVRVGKTCRSLSKMGYEVYFIGWDRNPDMEKTIDLGNTSMEIMKLSTRCGRWNMFGQFHFWGHIASRLRIIRPDTVCCVNEDLTFLVLPFRGIFYKYLVCDIYDSMLDRHSHRRWPLRIVLWVISKTVSAFADRLIVTDTTRLERVRERYRDKCVVVENVPDDPGEELSDVMPQGKIKIYVTGSLSSGRGLENIIKAVESIEDAEIISTGWPYYDYAREVFIKHPKVTFKGIVTLRQSLELAAQCDAILSFYAPVSVNNKYASPNKVYDAMSVGRPVIMNSEPLVAKWVEQNKVGFLCKYNDVEKLREIVKSLGDNRRKLPEFSVWARKLYLKNHTWAQMERRLKKLYNNIAVK